MGGAQTAAYVRFCIVEEEEMGGALGVGLSPEVAAGLMKAGMGATVVKGAVTSVGGGLLKCVTLVVGRAILEDVVADGAIEVCRLETCSFL